MRACIGKCFFNTLKAYTISYNFFNNWIYAPFISKILPSKKCDIILSKYNINHNSNNQTLYFNKKEIEDLETSAKVNYYKISEIEIDNKLNCIVPCTFKFLNLTLIHYGISYEVTIDSEDSNFYCQYNKIDAYFIKWYVQHFFKSDIICDENTKLSFIDHECNLKQINLLNEYILLEKDDYKILNN